MNRILFALVFLGLGQSIAQMTDIHVLGLWKDEESQKQVALIEYTFAPTKQKFRGHIYQPGSPDSSGTWYQLYDPEIPLRYHAPHSPYAHPQYSNRTNSWPYRFEVGKYFESKLYANTPWILYSGFLTSSANGSMTLSCTRHSAQYGKTVVGRLNLVPQPSCDREQCRNIINSGKTVRFLSHFFHQYGYIEVGDFYEVYEYYEGFEKIRFNSDKPKYKLYVRKNSDGQQQTYLHTYKRFDSFLGFDEFSPVPNSGLWGDRRISIKFDQSKPFDGLPEGYVLLDGKLFILEPTAYSSMSGFHQMPNPCDEFLK